MFTNFGAGGNGRCRPSRQSHRSRRKQHHERWPQHRLIKQSVGRLYTRKYNYDERTIRIFRDFRNRYINASDGCEFCDPVTGQRCATFPVTLHHRAGQEGENLFRYPMAVCRPHHDWIHSNQEAARQMGYLINADPYADIEVTDLVFTSAPVKPQEVHA